MHNSHILASILVLWFQRSGTSAFQPQRRQTLQGSASPRIICNVPVNHRPSIRLRQTTLDQTTQRQTTWNAKYQELVKFHQEHGHLNVDKTTKLYNWIHYQRRKYTGIESIPSLTEEQIRLLDEIGFSWEPRTGPHAKAWNARYQELAEFYRKHGHMRVEYQGTLYCWMSTQRRRRANPTEFANLTDDQIRLLDEIDFDWAPTGGTHDMAWHVKYQQLAEFHKQHGHLRVSMKSSLFSWKVAQRRKRKRMKQYAPLSDEQIQLLDDIDFQWADRQGAWEARYRELVEFYRQNGHLSVEQGSALFQWKITQRRKRRGVKGYAPLTVQQIRLLEKIGFS